MHNFAHLLQLNKSYKNTVILQEKMFLLLRSNGNKIILEKTNFVCSIHKCL